MEVEGAVLHTAHTRPTREYIADWSASPRIHQVITRRSAGRPGWRLPSPRTVVALRRCPGQHADQPGSSCNLPHRLGVAWALQLPRGVCPVWCVSERGGPVLRGVRRCVGGMPVMWRACSRRQSLLPCLRARAHGSCACTSGPFTSQGGCRFARPTSGGAPGVFGAVL